MPYLRVHIRAKLDGRPAFTKKMRGRTHVAIERLSYVFEGNAKRFTTREKHVITGRYRASINQSKGAPAVYTAKGKKGGHDPQSDGIHEWKNDLSLRSGTNVEYAQYLEKKYNILARALDETKLRAQEVLLNALAGL